MRSGLLSGPTPWCRVTAACRAAANCVRKIRWRQGCESTCQRHLSRLRLHVPAAAKPSRFDGRCAKAESRLVNLVLAHRKLRSQHRGPRGGWAGLQSASRSDNANLISDPPTRGSNSPQRICRSGLFVLPIITDHLSQQRTRRAPAMMSHSVMAIASASASSGDFGSDRRATIFSITRRGVWSAGSTPTTVFLQPVRAYSANRRCRTSPRQHLRQPRACPIFTWATPVLVDEGRSTVLLQRGEIT